MTGDVVLGWGQIANIIPFMLEILTSPRLVISLGGLMKKEKHQAQQGEYERALEAIQRMRSEGIDVDALTEKQMMELLSVYVLGRSPSSEIRAIIDSVKKA